MKGTFHSLLRKFCLEGTVAGLKYFYLYTDKASRCFWGLCMMFTACFACFLTYMLYRRFEAMPTRITIENQFEPIARLPYPAITICTPNQITQTALNHLDDTLVNGNRSLDLEDTLLQLLGFYHFVQIDPSVLQHLQALIQENRYSITDVLMILAQKCEDFLQMCVFKQRLYPRCKGLFKPLLTKHGVCCIFNSIYSYTFKINGRNERNSNNFRPHLVGRHGINFGLVVVADYKPHNAIDHSIHYSGSSRVMFTDWTEFPADDESLLVAPNSESFHHLRASATYCSSDVMELPSWSRKCAFEDEIQLPFFGRYRNSDCDLLCLVQIVEKQCGCLLFYLPQLHVKQVCGFDDILCVIASKLSLSHWLEQQQCSCPRDCDSRRYQADVTIGNLRALPHLIKRTWLVNANRSTSVMRFFFTKSVYEKQKQETVMSITTLASNLGGVFGLCLGCSVISVIELWFYNYTNIKNSFSRRIRNKKRRRAARRLYND